MGPNLTQAEGFILSVGARRLIGITEEPRGWFRRRYPPDCSGWQTAYPASSSFQAPDPIRRNGRRCTGSAAYPSPFPKTAEPAGWFAPYRRCG